MVSIRFFLVLWTRYVNINQPNLMLKPKYLRVLCALENGGEIKLMNHRIVMNENRELCCVMNSSEQGEILLGFDLPINSFIKLCEELKDTDIPLSIPKI